jgi:hypothetical protein
MVLQVMTNGKWFNKKDGEQAFPSLSGLIPQRLSGDRALEHVEDRLAPELR